MSVSAPCSVTSDLKPDTSALLERSRELLTGRVLVTGATGFIGANVVRALLGMGSDVHVIARASSPTFRLDDVLARLHRHAATLTDADALQRAFAAAQPHVVLHLATARGQGNEDRSRILEEIVVGSANILRLSREHAVCRVIVTNSSLEYRPAQAPLTEEAPLEPVTIHGLAKSSSTLLCQQAARDSGTPVCVLRLFHVYGPWESRHRLLPAAIRAALDGTPLPMTGAIIARDWVFVDDVVDAVVRAVGLDRRGEIINVGSGQEFSNEAVVALVAATLGKPIGRLAGAFAPRPSDVRHRRADRVKAARLLGWEPRHSLAAGVQRTLEWFQLHPAAWSAPQDAPPLVR
jgi:nucleoside-diphosphate-sugar epimerase